MHCLVGGGDDLAAASDGEGAAAALDLGAIEEMADPSSVDTPSAHQVWPMRLLRRACAMNVVLYMNRVWMPTATMPRWMGKQRLSLKRPRTLRLLPTQD